MFLYNLTFQSHNFNLFKYEMKVLFNLDISNKVLISNIFINPSESQFIKDVLCIDCKNSSYDSFLENIENKKISEEQFKIVYQKLYSNELDYEKRIKAFKDISIKISGIGVMINYKNLFGVTLYNGIFYFGKLIKNNYSFLDQNNKPFSYCNSLDASLANSIITIAKFLKQSGSIIDVCAGIGTIVINGLERNCNIIGYELNEFICNNANLNLKSLGFNCVIKNVDMTTQNEKCDVSILDIPYGVMSQTNATIQKTLISKCYEISEILILISTQDISELIISCNFKIDEKVVSKKSQNNGFTRNIYVCSRN